MSTKQQAWNIHTAIKQIESCDFECEAGPLKNNVAWSWLRMMANGPRYRIGDWVPHVLTATVDGFDLTRTVMLAIVAVRMDHGGWSYDLSKEPPSEYRAGSGVTAADVPEKTIDAVFDASPVA